MDHAAATPVDEGVLKAVVQTMKKFPGNPSALHREGQDARTVLEDARGKIGMLLGVHSDELVFTSGATEANNMAILGVVSMAHEQGIKEPHIIVSAIEHPSVLEVARALEKKGVRVDYLPVDAHGLVNPKDLRARLTKDTVLVSVMYANNEIGVIEPIRDIAKEVRHARKVHESAYPYFHTDAAQAASYLDMHVPRLGVDLMTLSSGKVYGPRGVGALFVRRGVSLGAFMYGGEHESGRRPGTEAVPLVVGFAEALMLAEKMKTKEGARVAELRDLLAEKIAKVVSDTSVNGSRGDCLPSMLNISFKGIESEALVLYLDAAGFAVSGKSACKSSASLPSHVIMALGGVSEETAGAIRFSLGRATKREDIVRVVRELARVIPLLRKAYTESDIV